MYEEHQCKMQAEREREREEEDGKGGGQDNVLCKRVYLCRHSDSDHGCSPINYGPQDCQHEEARSHSLSNKCLYSIPSA